MLCLHQLGDCTSCKGKNSYRIESTFFKEGWKSVHGENNCVPYNFVLYLMNILVLVKTY